MTRIPVIPTILVVTAAAIMVALGIWQIGRAQEKDLRNKTLLNRVDLAPTSYPYSKPDDEALLYRSLTAECSEVLSWRALGGQDVNNRNGWRQIATCRNAASGVEFRVDMGIGGTPDYDGEWIGGSVQGRAIYEPDTRDIGQLIMRAPRDAQLMVISDEPAPGLLASRQPDPSEEKNSSWAYAGQWFFFALTALAIYGFALRSRIKRRR